MTAQPEVIPHLNRIGPDKRDYRNVAPSNCGSPIWPRFNSGDSRVGNQFLAGIALVAPRFEANVPVEP